MSTNPSTTDTANHIQLINSFLDDFLSSKTAQASAIHQNYAQLWQELSRVVMAGGKRLRPQVVIQAYLGLGGTSVSTILPVAVALELLHICMLVHDDIIDRDDIRHGTDNMTGIYKKLYRPIIDNPADRQHFAESASLLAGDLLLSESYMLISQADLPVHTRQEVLRIFNDAVFKVGGGELLDTEASILPIGSIASEIVTIHKTASYSFVNPLLIGACLADADEQTVSHLQQFGHHLGIAFQLQDDMIGVFGDEKTTGKSAIGDLREGKRTQLIEQFYSLASPDQLGTFEQYFGNADLQTKDADELRQLLRASGAASSIERSIEQHSTGAKTHFQQVRLQPASQAFFEELIEFCTTRTH